MYFVLSGPVDIAEGTGFKEGPAVQKETFELNAELQSTPRGFIAIPEPTSAAQSWYRGKPSRGHLRS